VHASAWMVLDFGEVLYQPRRVQAPAVRHNHGSVLLGGGLNEVWDVRVFGGEGELQVMHASLGLNELRWVIWLWLPAPGN
jgi:hypothetical protein